MPNVKKTLTLRKHRGSYVAHLSVIFIRNSRFFPQTQTGASCIQATSLVRTRRCASFMILISRKKSLSIHNLFDSLWNQKQLFRDHFIFLISHFIFYISLKFMNIYVTLSHIGYTTFHLNKWPIFLYRFFTTL